LTVVNVREIILSFIALFQPISFSVGSNEYRVAGRASKPKQDLMAASFYSLLLFARPEGGAVTQIAGL
jgi:hypothetical protein